jgi:hypothetical protein
VEPVRCTSQGRSLQCWSSPASRSGVSACHFAFAFVLCLLCAALAFGQQFVDVPQVPRNFTFDLETAARLRPQLMAQSIAATGNYAIGRVVLEHLLPQIPSPSNTKLRWELRIVADDEFNAYSSPDGTIYVETGLARLAGSSAGLWAAILSHEIAHVVRRDWARRYLYQRSLESGAAMVLGEPGVASADFHWSDGQRASENFARLCRQLEIDADRDGLALMAKAGYHPDFVPALHHLLHAQESSTAGASASLSAMHPCWEERDHELNRSYVEADIEFEHRWLDWHASPGGNPPTLVFAGMPKLRKTSLNGKTGAKEWELEVPLRCENLVGAVEVVLRSKSDAERRAASTFTVGRLQDRPSAEPDTRQVTGCTSPHTTITFTLDDSANPRKPGARWTDVYILDASGAVLARADVPK